MLCVTMMILKGVIGMKRVNSTVPIPPGGNSEGSSG